MIGWLGILLLGAALLLLLWRFAGFRGGALQMAAATVLIAMAGYAWQGRPALESRPAASKGRQQLPDTAFAILRKEFFERFTSSERWLIIADGYQRRGDTGGAVGIIRAGLRTTPRDIALWTGLGNALVLHGGGTMNEAARLAYRRAAALAPEHPAAPFFYGLSLIQSGQVEEGERVWRRTLAQAPAGASWRPVIAERLEVLDQLRAMSGLPRPGATPPPQ
ncbi:MAG TPA: cytochrome C biogenesis protein [Allosphingosinicella sp.]|uniref:tetratricopeptide repeat protein n=1 Tax=Allosphingosinicella sp. TaxID=2823234 RepID=UPI002ED91D76